MLRVMLAMAVIASLAMVGSEIARADEVHVYPTSAYPAATYPTATYPTVTYAATTYPANTYYARGYGYPTPGYTYSTQYVNYYPASYPYGYSSYQDWYCHCRSGLFGRGGFLGTGLFR